MNQEEFITTSSVIEFCYFYKYRWIWWRELAYGSRWPSVPNDPCIGPTDAVLEPSYAILESSDAVLEPAYAILESTASDIESIDTKHHLTKLFNIEGS